MLDDDAAKDAKHMVANVIAVQSLFRPLEGAQTRLELVEIGQVRLKEVGVALALKLKLLMESMRCSAMVVP